MDLVSEAAVRFIRNKTILVCFFIFFVSKFSCGGEVISPQTGNWKGQPIGTYRLTRSTKQSITESKKTTHYSRSILLGQDEDNFTFLLTGKTNEKGTFVEEPRRSGGRAGGTRRIESCTLHTMEINSISFDVEKLAYGRLLAG